MDKTTIEQLAILEASKSKCKKRKVGAVIVNEDQDKVLAKGHNFIPNDIPCEDTDGTTLPAVIHAEVAAIKKLKSNKVAKYIYVTHQPCKACQKEIDKFNLEVVLVENFMKFDTGKLRYGLIPPEAMKAMAEVLTYGAKKYKPNNWQKADDTTRYLDALYRHLEAWRSGEKLDPESGLSHLSHAITNISFLIYFDSISHTYEDKN